MKREPREFWENEDGVHLVTSEFTLCGDAFDAPDSESAKDGPTAFDFRTRKRAVTCCECARIIRHCRGVRVAG